MSISLVPSEIDQLRTGILDGNFDRGVYGIQEGYTLWNPAGAVIQLDHLIAVGHVHRLRVELRQSARPSASVRFQGI